MSLEDLLEKLTHEHEEAKEMALLALHLSGIMVEKIVNDGHTRHHTKKEKVDGVGG
jgi:hypothetical protein